MILCATCANPDLSITVVLVFRSAETSYLSSDRFHVIIVRSMMVRSETLHFGKW